MRIAIVTPVLPPIPGGIGMVAQRQAEGLAKLGHEVRVFTPQTMRPFLRYRHAAWCPQLLWHLYRGKFDVVHLHYPFFGSAELFLFLRYFLQATSYKLVITYHHDVIGEGWMKKVFALHARYIMPRILCKADVVLVSSMDYAKSSLLKGEVFELPFGIDTHIFSPTPRSLELSQQYGIAPTDHVVMFLGGLDRAHYFKGVDVLIRAFSSVMVSQFTTSSVEGNHGIKLMIAGDGNLRTSYQKLAQELGIADRVIFPGYVSEQNKPSYFNLADIVVLPSIDRSEAFGVVLLEAMACGKPVVASNLPGVRAVVKDKETGLLVSPGSVESLASALATLLQDNALRETMGIAARKRVEQHYTQDQEITVLERIMTA